MFVLHITQSAVLYCIFIFLLHTTDRYGAKIMNFCALVASLDASVLIAAR
jgi:hypothetical protein